MTAATTSPGLKLPTRATPPWLWVCLFGVIASVPSEISYMRSAISLYFGNNLLLRIVNGEDVTVTRLSFVFSVLIYAIISAGAVSVLFPRLRGWWVERRFKLASDNRGVLLEMQDFVHAYDQSISLRYTLRSGQMARLYPIGWRAARIAIFRPMAALWRTDREAAQAILLHEVAHRRQGDQLIVGLGSLYALLIRVSLPAYMLLVLIPIVIDLATARTLVNSHFPGIGQVPVTNGVRQALGVGGIATAIQVPTQIYLPVIALWLAEIDADHVTVRTVGPAALGRALRVSASSRISFVARMFSFLSHPAYWIRLRLGSAGPSVAAGFIIAWPAAFAIWNIAVPGVMTAIEVLSGFARSQFWAMYETVLFLDLSSVKPMIIVAAALLIAWPALALRWGRLWSSSPSPQPFPSQRSWWPCLAAAIIPVGMLYTFLIPNISTSLLVRSAATPPSQACDQFFYWYEGDGWTEENNILDAFNSRTVNSVGEAVKVGRRVDGAIRAALKNPPPGASNRAAFVKAMNDYESAVDAYEGEETDMLNGDYLAANSMTSVFMSKTNDAESLLKPPSQCFGEG